MRSMDPTGLDAALESARQGRQEAYAELWHWLSPAVAGYLRAKGSSEPEETTSEAFLGAFRALPTFVGDAAGFRGLVFSIAQRRLVDEHRRRARRPVEFAWSADTDNRVEDSAEHAALGIHGRHEARRLLESLPPDQKDVMMLRIFGDLTVDQVAAALGKSPGAVKQLQRRGLDNLRRRIGVPTASDLTSGRS